MITFLTILEIFIAIFLIVVILLQSGKGSELGVSFGAGASQTIFGGAGAGNFLTKTTAVLATLFFINAFAISMLVSKQRSGSIFTREKAPIVNTVKTHSGKTTSPEGSSSHNENRARHPSSTEGK